MTVLLAHYMDGSW